MYDTRGTRIYLHVIIVTLKMKKCHNKLDIHEGAEIC